MPKSDMWPGGVAMEFLSNMDSAGSRDSVISMNSGYSEDSMEHLSAEERACLMYLEETIEALEIQEDSGLSNDEQDPEEMGQMKGDDIPGVKSDESGGNQKSFLSCGVPTPLAYLPAEPGSGAITVKDKAELHALSQTSESQSTAASSSINLMTQLKPQVTESVSSPATRTEVLGSSTDGPGNPMHVTTGQSTKASDIDLGLIPPPSDFMDEPDSPPLPEKEKHLPPFAGTSNNRPALSIDLEHIRQKASAKSPSVSTPVTQKPPNKLPAEEPATASLSSPVASGPPVSLHPEAAEPRSPPAVAPKPKKLPANIILKSHKASVAGSDGNLVHSVPTSSDRQLLDPQRVHIEALRKLGLLKSNDAESSPALSPKLSPKTQKLWTAPPSPISPAAPHTPPATPSYSHVNSTPPASVPVQSLTAVAPSSSSFAAPDILPAPAAFSDGYISLDTELSAVKDVLAATVVQTKTPPLLVKRLTPPKKTGVKSATLERSGMGLSSYMATQESTEVDQGIGGAQSLSQLRNNRPRPASLGSRKEFSSSQGEGVHPTSKDSDPQRPLPVHTAFQHSGESQKLPRSQGISVLISPRAENGENRRVALRKLGLLRD
ncbi:hypothetical protein PAMP_012269 [Pampus punctatissimus]